MINRRQFLYLAGTGVVNLLNMSGLPFIKTATASSEKNDFSPDIELSLAATPSEVRIFTGQPTTVWQYTGQVIKGDPQVLRGRLLAADNFSLARAVAVELGFTDKGFDAAAKPTVVLGTRRKEEEHTARNCQGKLFGRVEIEPDVSLVEVKNAPVIVGQFMDLPLGDDVPAECFAAAELPDEDSPHELLNSHFTFSRKGVLYHLIKVLQV